MLEVNAVSVAIPTGRLSSGALAAERAGDGLITSVFLDAEGSMLTEIGWRPGHQLVVRHQPLARSVPKSPSVVSLAGEHFALGVPGARLTVVHRITGAVEDYHPVEQPAAFARAGQALISATDNGLTMQVVTAKPGEMPWIRFVRPILVLPLDTPDSMLVVPGASADEFDVVLGGYGQLAIVRIRGFANGLPVEISAQQLETAGLPYDPLHLEYPRPLASGPGCHVFAVDWGRAGLVAVELATGTTRKCPIGENVYGKVLAAVPKLDGTACLVTTADGMLAWTPGEGPVRLRASNGSVVLWCGRHLLVHDHATSTLREDTLDALTAIDRQP